MVAFSREGFFLVSHEPLGRCPQGKANTRNSRNASRYALAVGYAECTRPGGKAQAARGRFCVFCAFCVRHKTLRERKQCHQFKFVLTKDKRGRTTSTTSFSVIGNR